MAHYVKEKLKEWAASPLLFVKEAFDWSKVPKDGPSEQQAEALARFNTNKRTSIRSGHGTGKDAFAAWIILWFMSTRPYPKVACTAPTARQLADILWSEISKWLRVSVLTDEFILQKDKLFHKDAPKEWWCRAISPAVKASKEEQAETLAGLHSEHLLIIVDEASGVPDPVFIPLEGAMTQEDNRVLLIGNPTKNTGYFHETQFDPKIGKKWLKLHWDSRKSTNVTKEMIDYFRYKYGEGSNIWRVRVEGEPPLDNENTYIPLSWAISCIGNPIDVDETWPLYLGVDVARYGEDDSIILPRQGMKIFPWDTYKGVNTIELAQHIGIKFADLEADGVGIDEIGVGGGVIDWHHTDHRGLGRKIVQGISTAWKAWEPEKYYRLRDQLWGAMRENCMHQKYSFPDMTVKIGGVDLHLGHELSNELASPLYKFKNGAVQLESKDDMKKRGFASPNIADALAITEYFYGAAHTMWKSNRKEGKKSKQPGPTNYGQRPRGSQSWMGV